LPKDFQLAVARPCPACTSPGQPSSTQDGCGCCAEVRLSSEDRIHDLGRSPTHHSLRLCRYGDGAKHSISTPQVPALSTVEG